MEVAGIVIQQALILVGGNASRLKAGGIPVPLSKAFIKIAGKSLFYWNLQSLHAAGIRHLIIAADKTNLLYAASIIIRKHPCKFTRVIYFHDEGNGAHGLPYELRYLLDDTFVFECGHSISRPEHYTNLLKAKGPRNVVFSAFKGHSSNRRQPVLLKDGAAYPTKNSRFSVIAHPIVADKNYATNLLRLKFNINSIIDHYSQDSSLNYTLSDMPPEYDMKEEMIEAHHIYEHYLASLAKI